MKFFWFTCLTIFFVACVSTKITTAPSFLPVDTQGCLSPQLMSALPKKPTSITDVKSSELYYEDLEYHYILTSEHCLSDSQKCSAFENTSQQITTALFDAITSDDSLNTTIHNSNNKILAMVAVNTFAYQKKYGKSLNLESWLIENIKKNDLSHKEGEVTVLPENKKYLRRGHNIATTSARAVFYVGLLTKNSQWMKTALSQIDEVIKTMRPDGSLPIETRRGARALRYSQQVLSDLISMIAISKDHKNLYHKFKPSLEKMIAFDMAVLADNQKAATYAQANFSPGPMNDYNKQDISNLRSRMAWVFLLKSIDPLLTDTILAVKIDKSGCTDPHLQHRFECQSENKTVSDVIVSPLGFTLGFNPRCVPLESLR